jgi:hypothetical protein
MYHGAMTATIQKFHDFTHFGTEVAAFHAVLRKTVEGAQGAPTIYEVSIDLEKHELLHVEDWGRARPVALANVLRKLEQDKLARPMEELWQRLTGQRAKDPAVHAFGNDAIKAHLRAHGFDGLIYENLVEAERGTRSICLADCSAVEIVNVRSAQSDELEQSKKRLREPIPLRYRP